MYSLIFAVCWAPVSFLLHNVLHEGAHALSVRSHGGNIVSFKPWPHRLDGRWVFAAVQYYTINTSPWETFEVLIAPLILEFFWALGALLLVRVFPALFLVEAAAASVDMTTWLLGAWLNHEGTDGGDLRRLIQKDGVIIGLSVGLVGLWLLILLRLYDTWGPLCQW